MKLRFISALFVFISSYAPLGLIFIIKDLDAHSLLPQHPRMALLVASAFILACIVTIIVPSKIKSGLPVKILRISNKSGDMFTYTIPYMISFYNFTLGDWKTLLSLFVFMALMFTLSYRTQSVFINPILALVGFGLYDCVFKDGAREVQGLLLSKLRFEVGDTCIIERLSTFLYFVKSTDQEGVNLGS